MANLGKAFVTIVPKAEGITEQIQNIVDPGAQKAGRSGGQAISSGIGDGIVKAGMKFTQFAASGAAAIAGIAGGISAKTFSGGIARAMKIDEASAKFKQLKLDWSAYSENISASVKDTKYGFDDMSTVALNFASTGIKAGEGMENALKSVASAASISGIDLGHMGAIYTKVAAAGKLTGGVMQQLQENGINANAALQEALGKSSEEISKMVSKGEIDFETFSTAMKDYFGDAADSANATFSGASANVQAALNRIGANFTAGPMEAVRRVFAGEDANGNKIDGKGLMGAIDNINKALKPAQDMFGAFADNVGGKVSLALERFNSNMGGIIDTFGETAGPLEMLERTFGALSRALFNTGGPLEKVGQWFDGLSEPVQNVLKHVGKFAGIFAGGAAAMGILGGAVGQLVPGLSGLIGPLIGSGGAFGLVTKLGKTFFGVIGSLLGGGGVGGLSGVLGTLTGPLGIVAALFAGAFASSEEFRSSIFGLVQSVGSSLQPVIASLMDTFKQLLPTVIDVVSGIGSSFAPVINLLAPVIARLVGSIGQLIAKLASSLLPIIQRVAPVIADLVATLTSALAPVLDAIVPIIDQLAPIITNIANMVVGLVVPAIQQLTPFIAQLVQTIGMLVADVAAALIPLINTIIPIVQSIMSVVMPIVTTIAKVVITAVNGILQAVGPILSTLLNIVTTILSTMASTVSRVLSSIKGFFSTAWNTIKSVVTTAVNAVKTVIGGISSVIGNVRSTFNQVKEAIQRPIENVRDKVKGIIDKIKGFFHFSVPKPHIPLPHFGISPAGWSIKDLVKGKIPHLSVTWAAQGGIMDAPTLVGAGEAGKEALLPLDPFWNRLDGALKDRGIDYDLLAAAMVRALSSVNMTNQLVCDGREIAKATAPYIQTETERLTKMQNRKLGYA